MDGFKEFQGFEIAGCAVRRKNILAFWAQCWDDPDPLEVRVTKIYFFYPDKPIQSQWSCREIGNTRGIRGCGVVIPEERWIFVADDGAVFMAGGGRVGWEADIPVSPFWFFNNIKCISGRAYAVGPRRKVFVRDAPDTWRHLSAGLPEHDQHPTTSGFSDVDGFNENDLYACGGDGDLWHFNGANWRSINIPTEANLNRVCCASDGLAYVLTSESDLLVGRDQRWWMLGQDVTDARFASIVEYDKKLILSTESALFEVANGVVRPATLGAMPTMRSCSFLAARDGVLLVAGSRDACNYDGTSWSVIVKL